MTSIGNNQFRLTHTRFALVLMAAAGLAMAQNQPPAPAPQAQPAPGGWRRVGDPPPPAAVPVPVSPNQSQDPSEPVDRSDQSGQPVMQEPLPPGQQPGYPNQQPGYPNQQPVYPNQQPAYSNSQPGYQGPQGPPDQRPNDRPASRPAYGLPHEVTMAPGTFVTIRTNQPLSSDHNQPGDSFSATLAQPVVLDGIVVAQRGQAVYGRVAEAQKAHSSNSSRLGLELTSLTLVDGTQVPIRSQLVARQGSTTPAGAQAGTIVGTTAVGAAVGGVAGYGTGAAIGAGVGATAGIIGVLLTRNHPTIVYPETALTFRVESPVTISTVRAPQAFRYVGPDEYSRGYNAQLQPRPAAPMGPAPYYYGPGYYPSYPYYWGPSVSFLWGPGYFYGRGYYRRWR